MSKLAVTHYAKVAANDLLDAVTTTEDVYRALAKLTEEVGELARAVLGLEYAREGRTTGDPAEEVGDVFLCLFNVARRLNIDIDKAIFDALSHLDGRVYFVKESQ